MARHALLIGVSDFVDKRLARLNAPTNDVIAIKYDRETDANKNTNFFVDSVSLDVTACAP